MAVEFHTHVMIENQLLEAFINALTGYRPILGTSRMCDHYHRRSDKQRIVEAFKLGKLSKGFVLGNCRAFEHSGPDHQYLYYLTPAAGFSPVVLVTRDMVED